MTLLSMLNIPEDILEFYFEDEYQDLIHRCSEELKKPNSSQENELLITGILKYAEASEEWEKSYNYNPIHDKFRISIQNFKQLSSLLTGDDKLLIDCFDALSAINDMAVEVENGLIGNNPKKMAQTAAESAQLAQEMIAKFPDELDEESSLVEMKGILDEYFHYQGGMAEYAELILLMRSDPIRFDEEYFSRIDKLKNHVIQLEEIGSEITRTEITAFLQNILFVRKLWEEKTPIILISDSTHSLSISFYVGADFANHIIKTFGDQKASIISKELFNESIRVTSGGIDTLDDFLETTIGSEYADKLHLMLDEGSLDFCFETFSFKTDLYIRRFGVATVLFTITLKDKPITVSDFRAIQQLVSPQSGTCQINWQDDSFSRLEDICCFIETSLINYHSSWKKLSKTLPEFLMDKVPFEHERTWYARSLLQRVMLKDRKNNTLTRIYDFKDLKKSIEFKGLVMPLFEGRSALDDWIQKEVIQWQNLAKIRSHSTDLIVQTRHSLVLFMPDDPDWIISQVNACGELVNDIATLILSFDFMAETVRSRLIQEVQNTKIALEQVQMKKVNEVIDRIRLRSIEITEFEMLALQSIQLLKSQGTLKYFDHSEFMEVLIENIKIDPIVNSLERKLELVRDSQKGIIRTADDLLVKYKDRITESQQRLIKVITLLIAGFAQISFIDEILNGLNIPQNLHGSIKFGVIAVVLIISSLALIWLAWKYFASRKSLFEEAKKT